MIASIKPCPLDDSIPTWHESFLEMLPVIQRHAKIAFRHLDSEARDEMVEEVVANAFVAFVRLVELGKSDVAFATPLAVYGVRQAKAGRRVGAKLNVCDVTSRHCQIHKGVRVDSLDHCDHNTDEWKEVVVEDKHAGPAAVASTRIDFAAWLRFLPARRRRIAKLLATGESTGEAARQFGVSHGRISQVRRELFNAWRHFQGEDTVTNQTAAVTA